MVARFGSPKSRSTHSIHAQGRKYELGPKLSFRQDDWVIISELVDGRCVRIGYGKSGEWTPEQIALVLSNNAQQQQWSETTKGTGKSSRSWRRNDGATADWGRNTGMKMVVPAYDRAKALAEAKAKAEASRKPKI